MLERLKDIFRGLESAHGVTKKTDEIRHDGKNEVRSKTIREPVTNELGQKHLDIALGFGGRVFQHAGILRLPAVFQDNLLIEVAQIRAHANIS